MCTKLSNESPFKGTFISCVNWICHHFLLSEVASNGAVYIESDSQIRAIFLNLLLGGRQFSPSLDRHVDCFERYCSLCPCFCISYQHPEWSGLRTGDRSWTFRLGSWIVSLSHWTHFFLLSRLSILAFSRDPENTTRDPEPISPAPAQASGVTITEVPSLSYSNHPPTQQAPSILPKKISSCCCPTFQILPWSSLAPELVLNSALPY